jgi:alkylation response protein AidB-like acyl-CoA dehydrogenase
MSDSKTDRIIEWLRDYCPRRINFQLMDERRCLSPNFVLDMARNGIMAAGIPEEYSGRPLPNSGYFKVAEQIAYFDLSTALFWELIISSGFDQSQNLEQPKRKRNFFPN